MYGVTRFSDDHTMCFSIFKSTDTRDPLLMYSMWPKVYQSFVLIFIEFRCEISLKSGKNPTAPHILPLQYVAKSMAHVKNLVYNQPKPYFFKKLSWSHFWIDFNQFYTKHSELSIFWLFICSLCLFEWFLFVHDSNTTNKNLLWFSYIYIFKLKINPKN